MAVTVLEQLSYHPEGQASSTAGGSWHWERENRWLGFFYVLLYSQKVFLFPKK
jgi:hypothetical protein